MSGDIYSSLSGATAAMQQMEVVSQNIANSNTAGYKEMRMTFRLEGEGEGPLGQSAAAANAPLPISGMRLSRLMETPTTLHCREKGFLWCRPGTRRSFPG